MNKIKLPEFNLQYFHLKVYRVSHQEDIKGRTFTTIVAPDSYVALAVFTALHPSLSSTGVTLLDDVISVFPQDI